MKTLKVALDWTANVNHIGIFIAQQLGFYQYKNLNVEILNPLEDNYELTPGKKLELDLCDFSIAPFETVISLNNKDNFVDAIAIYAILQEDLSSIVTLKSSKLDTPKLLDGKIYASYKARYEDHIVKEMVKNDGGRGDIQIIYPEKLGIWNTVLEGKADATWIFNNWEGIEAEGKMIELHKFSLGDFCIPYGYSPVIFAKNSKLIAQKTEYTAFVKATQEGYLYAKNNISEATKILKTFLTDYDKANIDIEKSVKVTAPFFGNEANCGKMQPEKLTAFFKWLSNNQLESSQILEQTLFTNELFV